jgi:soluble lytic murein transglycosylase-like protein
VLLLRDRLYIFLPTLLIFVGVVYSIFSDSGTNSLENMDDNLPSADNEIIVAPQDPTELKKDPLERMLNLKSFENIYKMEKSFLGWSDLFESFTFNLNSNAGNQNKLSEIPGIDKVKYRSLGNVDALVDAYGVVIVRECNFYKMDWRLILALIRQESYFNPEAKSHAGAFGFMQIMPGTGAGLEKELNLDNTQVPDNNLIAGIYYYAKLVASFEFTGEDKYKFALAAYNGGFGRVIDAMTIASYFEKDHEKWDEVKQMYPYLASNQDSVHTLVWPNTKRPQYGALNNWMEPYNYVENVMYFYEQYQKMYESNLKEEKSTKKKSKKNSKKKSK